MNRNSQFTLSESLDLYFAHNDISKKKYFGSYLVTARFVWKDIFKQTIWQTMSTWETVQDGDPYPYINIPEGAERVFSVGEEDDCHRVTPLFYNNRINVVKKPTVKKCGCTSCNCGGLCSDANALTYTTRIVFTINGINYYEKKWTEVCANGDILIFTETPAKKYNDLIGDGGDFNTDFNNDYDIAAAPFSDYDIVYVKKQEKVCSIEVMPCGCPVDTPENQEVFNQFCGCFLPPCNRKKKHCDDFLTNPQNNDRGECKISDCGTKIYYRPSRNWRAVSKKKIPDFLLVNWQSNAEICGQEVLVPEYALDCLFDGIDYFKKKRKDKYSYNDKLGAKWQYEDSRSKLILYLSPFDLEEMAHIQSAQIKW